MTATPRQPPLRDFADRGTAWLLESPENLRGLVGLLDSGLVEQLDFTRATADNRPLVSDDLDKRLNDVLYRVPYKDGGSEVWICILLEHQSTPDPYLGFRLLRYMVGIWGLQLRGKKGKKRAGSRRRLTPIVPIVFYTGKRSWSTALSVEAVMDLPETLSRFVPRHDSLFLNLKQTPRDLLTGTAIALVLRVMQVEDAPLEKLEQVLAAAVEALDDLPEEMWAERREALYYLLLLIRHRRAAEEQERLVTVLTTATRKHRKEVITMKKMSAVETWTQEGRKEGRKEGLQLAVRLLSLLQERFGPLPQYVPSKLEGLSVDEVEALLDKAATAATLADLHLAD